MEHSIVANLLYYYTTLLYFYASIRGKLQYKDVMIRRAQLSLRWRDFDVLDVNAGVIVSKTRF